MSLILLAGNVVLDVINEVEHYPREDEELRAYQQRVAVGGNAANTAQVLVQQGHRVKLCAVLAEDADGQRCSQGLAHAGVDLEHIVRCAGHTPVSYITLNRSNGSRTIVHHRDLPELAVDDLELPDYGRYDWLHFEGRNVEVLQSCFPVIREQCVDQGISLEIEKTREGIEQLIPYVDVVMFSANYAQSRGFSDAATLLCHFHDQFPEHLLSCTWGARGAWAIDRRGELIHQPALQVDAVDTIGAGDVFNAGLINGLVSGLTLPESLQQAVTLAAVRVTQVGIAELLE